MLFEDVLKTIDRYHLLERGDRIVLGVSGGVDSMVLLHFLNTLRKEFSLSLIVAHVNHGLRPDESKREAELVEKESTRLGLPFEYGRFDVKEFSQTAGLSLQDAARRIRFHFFKTLLLKYGAQKIALGHNADDQVETILLRLFRGSGLKGLRGCFPSEKRERFDLFLRHGERRSNRTPSKTRFHISWTPPI
jgi:tRNA(Ile)-lysidine synthase